MQEGILAQLAALGLAFLLSALVGAEREARQKSAGLRTHTLVGVSAALFMLISKFGFNDVLAAGTVRLDPSRVAAQIVTGIGFIGGGVIFMRRDVVRGLTTAASVWFTAAVGMACGAGLFVLGVAASAGYFLVMLAFPVLVRHLPGASQAPTQICVSYRDGHGVLRDILGKCSEYRFSVDSVRQRFAPAGGDVTLTLCVRGKEPIPHLVAALSHVEGVREVARGGDEFEYD